MTALGQGVSLRQTQSAVLSPQIMQAIRILSMSAQELDSFLASELERNPLLNPEESTTTPEDRAKDSDVQDRADGDETNARQAPADGDSSRIDEGELSRQAPGTDPDRFSGGTHGSAAAGNRDSFGEQIWLQHQESLYALLERRIEAAFPQFADRLIAQTLLASLDPCGYLGEDLSGVSRLLGCGLQRVEAVLATCQELAPTGVFARSLKECLTRQLEELNRFDPAMAALLEHLPLLAAGRIDELMRVCDVDRADMMDMIAELKALDPKPGLAYAFEHPATLVPDVLVRPAGKQGEWDVELNPHALPRVIVDRLYLERVSCGKIKAEERRYLSDCLQKATWLERSLNQRAVTVLKVASEIVRWQTGFLERGVEGLRPLCLRSIAEAIGVHESTASRAAANKSIATPRGIFQFRYFFSSSVGGNGSEAHSPESVKFQIRKLLSSEGNENILSDNDIASLLRRDGVSIARRTVAKYRESMRIASSSERKKMARLAE